MNQEINKLIPTLSGTLNYVQNHLALGFSKLGLTSKRIFPIFFMLLLLSEPVLAHPGKQGITSFSTGLAHPWLGLDHLTVMLAIGLWSRSVQTTMAWRLPLAFLLFMVLGAVFSYLGIRLLWVEQGIVLSLILLGILLLLDKSVSLHFMPILIAPFGLYHGYAHGAEIVSGHNQLSYLFGFVSSTALLQLIGISLAGLNTARQPSLRKSTGLFCLAVGSMSLV